MTIKIFAAVKNTKFDGLFKIVIAGFVRVFTCLAWLLSLLTVALMFRNVAMVKNIVVCIIYQILPSHLSVAFVINS